MAALLLTASALLSAQSCSSNRTTAAPMPHTRAPRPVTSRAPASQRFGPYLVPGGHLIVGVKPDQPRDSLQTGSAFTGYQIDLVNYLANATRSQVTSSPVVTQDRVTRLQDPNGSQGLDMVVADFSDTPLRETQVEMAGPYMRTPQGILVRKGYNSIHSYRDLKDKAVCTTAGSTSIGTLKSLGIPVRWTPQDYFGKCVQMLESGQVDAVSTDMLILYGFQQAYPAKIIVATDTQGNPVEVPASSDNNWMVGLPPGDRIDCQKVVKLLRAYLSHQWVGAFNKWFSDAEIGYPDFSASFLPTTPPHCTS
jgi:glutamate transport system substrate-binding protein